MTTMKITGAVMLGVAVLAGASQVSAQQLTVFTAQNVRQALEGIGLPVVETGTVNGPNGALMPILKFEANGLAHNALLEVCDANGQSCLGLHLATTWTLPVAPDINALNNFNIATSFGKAVAVGAKVAVTRYVISDAGVSMANVQENIKNHVGLAQQFPGFYQKATGASSVSLKIEQPAAKTLGAPAPSGIEALLPLLGANDLSTAKATPISASGSARGITTETPPAHIPH